MRIALFFLSILSVSLFGASKHDVPLFIGLGAKMGGEYMTSTFNKDGINGVSSDVSTTLYSQSAYATIGVGALHYWQLQLQLGVSNRDSWFAQESVDGKNFYFGFNVTKGYDFGKPGGILPFWNVGFDIGSMKTSGYDNLRVANVAVKGGVGMAYQFENPWRIKLGAEFHQTSWEKMRLLFTNVPVDSKSYGPTGYVEVNYVF